MNLGATFIVLTINICKKINEYHRIELNASKLVLSTPNDTKMQSHGTIIHLCPDVTEYRMYQNTSLTFHVSNTKINILGTPDRENYV